MEWQRGLIVQKVLSAFIAVVLAFGLLHAPSMMLGTATAATVDCHSATAHVADADYHPFAHEHATPADPSSPAPATDHAQASGCPLANLTGIANSAPTLPVRLRGMTIAASEPPVLLASVFYRPDPPPRSAP
jgi:hypothetical protein